MSTVDEQIWSFSRNGRAAGNQAHPHRLTGFCSVLTGTVRPRTYFFPELTAARAVPGRLREVPPRHRLDVPRVFARAPRGSRATALQPSSDRPTTVVDRRRATPPERRRANRRARAPPSANRRRPRQTHYPSSRRHTCSDFCGGQGCRSSCRSHQIATASGESRSTTPSSSVFRALLRGNRLFAAARNSPNSLTTPLKSAICRRATNPSRTRHEGKIYLPTV